MMKNVIFYNKGYEKTGKSASVKAVFRELASRVPEKNILRIAGSADAYVDADIKGIITYREVRIGIESEGDPGYRQPQSIKICVAEGCSIIVCACRTKGETHDVINEVAGQCHYELFAAPHFCVRNLPDDVYSQLNSEYAHQVVRWIDWWIDNM